MIRFTSGAVRKNKILVSHFVLLSFAVVTTGIETFVLGIVRQTRTHRFIDAAAVNAPNGCC